MNQKGTLVLRVPEKGTTGFGYMLGKGYFIPTNIIQERGENKSRLLHSTLCYLRT